MLYQPTNIYPSMTGGLGNGVVDASKDLTVSWQVNGNSAMVSYQIVICKNNSTSDQVYSTGKISAGCPFYGVDYAGNVQFFSYTISASALQTAKITNGNEYKILITQWWSVSDSVTQSSASVFITRAAPVVTMGTIPSPVAAKSASFSAEYTQTQGDNLNWVRWELALVDGTEYEILRDTGRIYGTAQLRFDYDGFFSGKRYAVRCTVQTQNGIEATTGFVAFSVSYQTQPFLGTLRACPVNGVSGVKLNFPATRDIPAALTGSATMSGSFLNLPAGAKAVWNKVNSADMRLDAPLDIVWRGMPNANGTLLKVSGKMRTSAEIQTLPAAACWDGIAYGNGVYVAVAASGEMAYSTDEGETWTAAESPAEGAGWFSVCYGGGKFVAVACDSAIAAYSADGKTWTKADLPVSAYWNSVCYGGGYFVAAAHDYFARSEDGIHWGGSGGNSGMSVTDDGSGNLDVTQFSGTCTDGGNGEITMEADGGAVYASDDGAGNVVLVNAGSSGAVSFPGTWYSICYGAGMFVAVANSSADAAISSDGLSWTRCTLPEFGCWNAVCCGDGIFVAVQTGKICAYSSDGMTWYSRNMPQEADWTAAAYGNGRFFAVSSGGTVCAKSQDGAVWTADTMPMAANWSAVCYGGEGFAAVADSTQKMAVVTESGGLSDGTLTVTAESNTLYETMTMPVSAQWSSVCYGNGKFVAVWIRGRGAYSADGKSWQNSGLGSSYLWNAVCYGNGMFVAVTITGKKAAVSADGISWQHYDVPVTDCDCVLYANGAFWTFGGFGICFTSTDGINWTQKTTGTEFRFKGVCYGGGKFVAVSTQDAGILYSSDAQTWTLADGTSGFGMLYNVCYGDGKFVAVGLNGKFLSGDGVTWTKVSDGGSRDVAYGNGKFAATATNNTAPIWISSDGSAWVQASGQTTTVNPNRICHGNNLFVVLPYSGNTGYVLPSESEGTLKFQLNDTITQTKPVPDGNFLSIVSDGTSIFFCGGGAADSVSVPIPWEYITALELDGVQSCDYLFVSNGKLSEETINKILTDGSYHPNDLASRFFADFDGSANGGGVGDTKIFSFAIYRKTEGSAVLEHVLDTDSAYGDVLFDCGAATGKNYTYYAYGIGGDKYSSSALISNEITPCFWDWTILSCTQDAKGIYHAQEIFRFGKNLVSGAVSNNNAPQVMLNFTPYPTIQAAPQNYRSGTLQSLIGTIMEGTYSDTPELKKAVYGLSVTQRTLFLKNRKGELMKIRISGPVTMETMDDAVCQAQTVSIPWAEVGSAENVQIVLTQQDDAWPY
nr:MAG TPA: Fibronectin type III domain-containing protein, glycosyl hydrolase, 7-fold beta-propeller [Caudoviricetes sp.]